MLFTLTEICGIEFGGDIRPDQMIEFAYFGDEQNKQRDYLDEILETHGDEEVMDYHVVNSKEIKVLFKKEEQL